MEVNGEAFCMHNRGKTCLIGKEKIDNESVHIGHAE